MPNYRRVYIPGGIYFFTIVTFHHLSFLTLKDARITLQNTWCKVQQKRPFQLIALCLLPDHLHCMWKLPENDYDYSTRWQKIKDGFSQAVDRSILPLAKITVSRKSKSEAPIWQRRFWEHTIRNQADYNNHINYIHYNPVKHGYVQKAIDWPWSTFHQYLSKGIYHPDWGNISSTDKYSLKNAGE